MKSGMLFDNFYNNFTVRVKEVEYCFYIQAYKKKYIKYLVGNDLLTLGVYNCSVVNNRDIVRLRNLYVRIIRWLVDEMKDDGRAKLYLLRGEKLLDRKISKELQDSISIVEFDRITQKTFRCLSRGWGGDDALGYAYRLRDWVSTLSQKCKARQAAGQPIITGSDIKLLDQELWFLNNLWDSSPTDSRKFHTVSLSIYQMVADLYIETGKKDKALELLNIALSQSDKYKERVGRAIDGSVKIKRQAKLLSRELTAN